MEIEIKNTRIVPFGWCFLRLRPQLWERWISETHCIGPAWPLLAVSYSCLARSSAFFTKHICSLRRLYASIVSGYVSNVNINIVNFFCVSDCVLSPRPISQAEHHCLLRLWIMYWHRPFLSSQHLILKLIHAFREEWSTRAF